MQECGFKENGRAGGRTAAQRFVDMHERALREVCGSETYDAIKEAVDKAAETTDAPSAVMELAFTAFVGTVTGCDTAEARRRVERILEVTARTVAAAAEAGRPVERPAGPRIQEAGEERADG